MKLFLFLFFFDLLSLPALAAETGCFTRHVSEAIRVNSSRLLPYARLTDGASVAVSQGLITSERETLIAAKYFDQKAKKHEEAGIPLLCSGFISMSKVSTFSSSKDMSHDPIEKFVHLNSHELELRLLGSFKKGGFSELESTLNKELEQLKDENYNCMLRHGLRSLRRFASTASLYGAESTQKGLISSERLSGEIIEAHIFALAKLNKLDEMAAVIQAGGVPILCQDLPPIP